MSQFATPVLLMDKLSGSMLEFPITDYDSSNQINYDAYAKRLDWLNSFGPSAIFPAAGAGEFFSLTADEYDGLLKTALETRLPGMPVVASTGFGTFEAIARAQCAESLGADGLLLLPPYLTGATQDGLFRHIKAVCESVNIGVIVYNRANCSLSVETVQRIAQVCPNLIGLKDGTGDIENMLALRLILGDRLMLINGMPTAEVFAYAYAGLGAPTYSSGVFNFIPGIATAFHRALRDGNRSICDRILKDFFIPFVGIRGRKPGYAVTVLRAGAEIVGRSAGPVRSPLIEITKPEYAAMEKLISKAEFLVSTAPNNAAVSQPMGDSRVASQ